MTPRSWLFVPADDDRKLAKAASTQADAVILDLEDSVALTRKPQARAMARDVLASPGAAGLWVRLNPLASGLLDADLEAVMPGAPAGVVLPKPDSAADVHAVIAKLQRLEAEHGLAPTPILPIATETPLSVFNLHSYVGVPAGRLAGMTWGAEDLPTAVGAESGRLADGGFTDLCRLARSLCLAGAAAAGVAAIETVYPAFRDLDGLAAYAERGRGEGFLGMLAIHPEQVETINRVFTPSSAALEDARRVVALFAANPGAGVVSLDGRMLDAPHLKQATRLLESQPRGPG